METSGLCFQRLAITVHIAGRRLNKSSNPSLMDSFNTKNCFPCNCVRAALYTQRSESGRSGRVRLRRLVSLDWFLPVYLQWLLCYYVPVSIPGNMDLSQAPLSEGKQAVILLLTPCHACKRTARNILQCLGKSAMRSTFLLWDVRAFFLLSQEAKILIEILTFLPEN